MVSRTLNRSLHLLDEESDRMEPEDDNDFDYALPKSVQNVRLPRSIDGLSELLTLGSTANDSEEQAEDETVSDDDDDDQMFTNHMLRANWKKQHESGSSTAEELGSMAPETERKHNHKSYHSADDVLEDKLSESLPGAEDLEFAGPFMDMSEDGRILQSLFPADAKFEPVTPQWTKKAWTLSPSTTDTHAINFSTPTASNKGGRPSLGFLAFAKSPFSSPKTLLASPKTSPTRSRHQPSSSSTWISSAGNTTINSDNNNKSPPGNRDTSPGKATIGYEIGQQQRSFVPLYGPPSNEPPVGQRRGSDIGTGSGFSGFTKASSVPTLAATASSCRGTFFLPTSGPLQPRPTSPLPPNDSSPTLAGNPTLLQPPPKDSSPSAREKSSLLLPPPRNDSSPSLRGSRTLWFSPLVDSSPTSRLSEQSTPHGDRHQSLLENHRNKVTSPLPNNRNEAFQKASSMPNVAMSQRFRRRSTTHRPSSPIQPSGGDKPALMSPIRDLSSRNNRPNYRPCSSKSPSSRHRGLIARTKSPKLDNMDASAAQQQPQVLVGRSPSPSHNAKITLTYKSPSSRKKGMALESPPFSSPGADKMVRKRVDTMPKLEILQTPSRQQRRSMDLQPGSSMDLKSADIPEATNTPSSRQQRSSIDLRIERPPPESFNSSSQRRHKDGGSSRRHGSQRRKSRENGESSTQQGSPQRRSCKHGESSRRSLPRRPREHGESSNRHGSPQRRPCGNGKSSRIAEPESPPRREQRKSTSRSPKMDGCRGLLQISIQPSEQRRSRSRSKREKPSSKGDDKPERSCPSPSPRKVRSSPEGEDKKRCSSSSRKLTPSSDRPSSSRQEDSSSGDSDKPLAPPNSKFRNPTGGRSRDSDTDQPEGPKNPLRKGERSPTRRHDAAKESDQAQAPSSNERSSRDSPRSPRRSSERRKVDVDVMSRESPRSPKRSIERRKIDADLESPRSPRRSSERRKGDIDLTSPKAKSPSKTSRLTQALELKKLPPLTPRHQRSQVLLDIRSVGGSVSSLHSSEHLASSRRSKKATTQTPSTIIVVSRMSKSGNGRRRSDPTQDAQNRARSAN